MWMPGRVKRMRLVPIRADADGSERRNRRCEYCFSHFRSTHSRVSPLASIANALFGMWPKLLHVAVESSRRVVNALPSTACCAGMPGSRVLGNCPKADRELHQNNAFLQSMAHKLTAPQSAAPASLRCLLATSFHRQPPVRRCQADALAIGRIAKPSGTRTKVPTL